MCNTCANTIARAARACSAGRPHGVSRVAVCSMNVHKRCQKNVANNCGINTKMMADILNEMGISPDKNRGPRPSKVPAAHSANTYLLY